jgi:hypothetical protein
MRFIAVLNSRTRPAQELVSQAATVEPFYGALLQFLQQFCIKRRRVLSDGLQLADKQEPSRYTVMAAGRREYSQAPPYWQINR